MRVLQTIGAIVTAVGIAGMLLTADGSLVWFGGSCIGFALGIIIGGLPVAIESIRERIRFNAKKQRPYIRAR